MKKKKSIILLLMKFILLLLNLIHSNPLTLEFSISTKKKITKNVFSSINGGIHINDFEIDKKEKINNLSKFKLIISINFFLNSFSKKFFIGLHKNHNQGYLKLASGFIFKFFYFFLSVNYKFNFYFHLGFSINNLNSGICLNLNEFFASQQESSK